jgi:hypothetical protein
MILLILRAYLLLLSFEFVISRRNFASLYTRVRTRTIRPLAVRPDIGVLVCGAINRACVFYFKEVQCLQRSAATVCLLRDLGVSGNLVIGAQHLPFRAHAWVEVDGKVVNDKADVASNYAVLDRC